MEMQEVSSCNKEIEVKEIVIYGAGGFARELAWLVQSLNKKDEKYEVSCFVEDDPERQGQVLNGIPTMSLETAYSQFPHAKLISGIGSPTARQTVIQKAEDVGYQFISFIHPTVEISQWVEVGVGSIICAGSILTTNIELGPHVQINLDCTVGHDVVMDDYATLAPGVHVSGHVRIGKRAYIGTGATIINGTKEKPLVLGDDVVVGAGACVTKSVSSNLVVVGVPAVPLKRKP